MARIRTIKPEFWTSEQVMECSPNTRLVFVGLWNFCDDGGNHPASAKTLKAEVLPGDDITTATVQGYIDELIKVGLIELYEADGKSYWHVTGWHHQKIDQPTFKYIGPDGAIPDGSPKRRSGSKKSANTTQSLDECSANTYTETHTNLAPCSTSVRGVFGECSPPEGKGREGSKPSAANVDVNGSGGRTDFSASASSSTANSGKPANPIVSRAIELTAMLRKRGASLQASDPRVIGWAERGISDAAALSALEVAQGKRSERSDPKPVNAGYLDSIITAGGAPNGHPQRTTAAERKAAHLAELCRPSTAARTFDGTADRVD